MFTKYRVNHFMMYVSQIIMLYPPNTVPVNKTGRKKKRTTSRTDVRDGFKQNLKHYQDFLSLSSLCFSLSADSILSYCEESSPAGGECTYRQHQAHVPACLSQEDDFSITGSVYTIPGRTTVADAVRTSPISPQGQDYFFMHMSPSGLSLSTANTCISLLEDLPSDSWNQLGLPTQIARSVWTFMSLIPLPKSQMQPTQFSELSCGIEPKVSVQERVNISRTEIANLKKSTCKVGPWLASGNWDFRRVSTIL